MACPKCGCKVTYTVNGIDDADDNYEVQRCSVCRAVFYTMDEEPEDDDCDLEPEDFMIQRGKG